jgi:hypothetical protein
MRARYLFVLILVMVPAYSTAQMTPVFGPVQFTRSTAAPQTFTDAFSHCGVAACQIAVVNGSARMTSIKRSPR